MRPSVVAVRSGSVVIRGPEGGDFEVKMRVLEILDGVRRHGSLSMACRELGVTLKTGKSWIRSLESRLGIPLVLGERGGLGGGRSRLTEHAQHLLLSYYSARSDARPGFIVTLLESYLSARNLLLGRVKSVKEGDIVSLVELDLDPGQTLKALVTTDSMKRMNLQAGMRVVAVIKATEVIVASEDTFARN
jgi:molybdenum-pterin binding domain